MKSYNYAERQNWTGDGHHVGRTGRTDFGDRWQHPFSLRILRQVARIQDRNDAGTQGCMGAKTQCKDARMHGCEDAMQRCKDKRRKDAWVHGCKDARTQWCMDAVMQ